jgi:hypothetical protein
MRQRLTSRLRRLSFPFLGIAASSGLLVFACSSNDYVYSTASGGGSSGVSSSGASSGTSSGGSSSSSGFFSPDADFPAQAIVKTTLLDRDPDAAVPDAGESLDAGPDGCSIPLMNLGSFGPPASPVASGTLFDGGRGKVEISCSVRETSGVSDQWAVSGTIRIGSGELILASTVALDGTSTNDADLLIRPEGVGGAAWSWNNCSVSFPTSAPPVASRRSWLKIKCGVSTGSSRPFCGVEAEIRLENCLLNTF